MISKNISNSERDFIDDDKLVRESSLNDKNSSQDVLSLGYTKKLAEKLGEASFGAKGKNSQVKKTSQARDSSRISISATNNIIKKKNKNGLMAIHKALTGISLISNNRYINVNTKINWRMR